MLSRGCYFVVALLLIALAAAGCVPETSSLEATVVAQGQRLDQLARTATATPPSAPTAPPTATLPPPPTPTSEPTQAPSATATPTPSLRQVVDAALPSVLRVTSGGGVGTGFVAWKSEQVLTALHVVREDPDHLVLLTEQGVQYKATVLAADETRDLALLSAPGLQASPLPMAAEVALAESVTVLGYQDSLPGGPSVTRGIVSALRRGSGGVPVIQSDAAMNPGASGGPMLDDRGSVLGLVSYGVRGGSGDLQGLGFAIAVQELESFRADVEAGRLTPLPTPTEPSLTPTTVAVAQ